MKNVQIAERYARAIYEIAMEQGNRDRVFNELRALKEAFEAQPEILDFMRNPLVSGRVMVEVFKHSLPDTLSPTVHNFVLLLAEKERLAYFAEIVQAFQEHNDQAHGVVRGRVESATALGPEARRHIEDIVKKVTQKDVILTYDTDPTIIGGLVATVGSFTFDDTIQSHLNRLRDDLNRRVS